MKKRNHRRSKSIAPEIRPPIEEIREAYRHGNLTLYLGAGVSKDNGLPNWAELVLTMYFTATERGWKQRWRAYPNYLYAIAEWQLQRRTEPPEITAQKVRLYYRNPKKFLSDLHKSLYGGGYFYRFAEQVRQVNAVLNSVAQLCRLTRGKDFGIQAVVTYNYDNLLELATKGSACEFVPVWKSSAPLKESARPIFHVHGYIPAEGNVPDPDSIVFTEAQYHAAANDPYSWSNLCQIQCMSSSIGLMVGLSLTDSNMRRLLTALKITPLRKSTFALLKKPQWPVPTEQELNTIHESAQQYKEKLEGSGIKAPMERNVQMREIIDVVNRNEQDNHAKMLEEFGITPIWFEEYDQVPGILDSILAGMAR